MIQYNPFIKEHAEVVEHWWSVISKNGELNDMFTSNVESLPIFYSMFNDPTQFYFEIDEKGIWLSIWFSPFLAGAWTNVWLREDKRLKVSSSKLILNTMAEAFKVVPVLLALTKKPELLDMYTKLGYDVSMVVPQLFGDKPGWILQMPKANFKHLKEEENGRRHDINTDTPIRANSTG